MGGGQRLRGARARRLATSATGRSRPATSRPTPSTRPRRSGSGRRSTTTGSSSRRSRTTTTTSRGPAERESYHAHLRACIDAAAALGGVPSGRSSGATRTQRRGEPERGRARLPTARRLRRRARRAPDDRELRDGGLADPDGYPGNLAYSPELWEWMFSLGLLPELRPVAPALARDRPGRGAAPYVDQRRACARQGRRDLPGRAQPLRLLRADVDARGRSVGHGLVAVPDPGLGQVDFRATSTRSTRAGSTASSRSSTRTRSGAARRSWSRPACGSPTTTSGLVVRVTKVLEVRNLVKEFPGVKALQGVDLDVLEARCTACSARTAPASRR